MANLPDPRLRFAAFGRLPAKPRPSSPVLARAIALGPIGLRPREVARVETRDGRLRHRRVDHQDLEHVLGLTAIVGIGTSPHDS
jgi:hypothetical protein